MTRKISFLILLTLLITCCKKSKDFNELIIGEWQLDAIYSGGWITIKDSPVQTIKFKSNGE